MAERGWVARLTCWLRGHKAFRVRGTFLVKCDRCGAFANLRLWSGKEK